MEARQALETAAIDLGSECGAAYIELRDGLQSGNFVRQESPYYRFRRRLAGSEDDNMALVPRKQRRMIRVGQRSGLSARVGSGDLEAFHDLYARSVRRLGTPVFSPSYFRLLCERFADSCVLLTVHHGETPAAAVLSFVYKDVVMPYYAGSRHELRHHAVNDFLYWELMRWAVQRGIGWFDFGRSKEGSGAYDYKRHWGFAAEPLCYRFHASRPRQAPRRTLNDAPVRLLRSVWSWLPLPLTKLIGPPIVQRFGPYYT
jgi:FemAB-related protein (PEP-CTERM system-associated)